ncbi:MAG: hypothetical protein M3Q75_11305, partial [Gemmatimonadota bacterium]|nr:hypothetical protein [Gemmatimonadota bacterium]
IRPERIEYLFPVKPVRWFQGEELDDRGDAFLAPRGRRDGSLANGDPEAGKQVHVKNNWSIHHGLSTSRCSLTTRACRPCTPCVVRIMARVERAD